MERYFGRHQWIVGASNNLVVSLKTAVVSNKGQGTAEFAIVLVGFLAVMMGLGTFVQTIDTGIFIEHALAAASHHVQAQVGWVADVFAY